MTLYTVTLTHTMPAAAGIALDNMLKTRTAAKRYLDDVNSSAYYRSDVLIELVIEAFALTDAEARSVYKEWAGEVE